MGLMRVMCYTQTKYFPAIFLSCQIMYTCFSCPCHFMTSNKASIAFFSLLNEWSLRELQKLELIIICKVQKLITLAKKTGHTTDTSLGIFQMVFFYSKPNMPNISCFFMISYAMKFERFCWQFATNYDLLCLWSQF